MAWRILQSFSPSYHPRLLPLPERRLPDLDWMKTGAAIDASILPKTLKLMSGAKKLHAFIPALACGPFVASDEFRAIVETMEPGLHQFVPVEVVYKDGRVSDLPYFFVNIMQVLNSIRIENSNVYWVAPPNPHHPGALSQSAGPFKLTLNKTIVAGKHFWRERLFNYGVFFSDELMERCNALKLRGLSADVVLEA